MAGTTVAFHTLGCKLNFAESSTLLRNLEQDGFIRRDFEEQADIYVVNTCSVTSRADQECRALVRRIKRQAPASKVVITGCYAQLKPQEIAAVEGVDLVLGANEKFHLVTHLKNMAADQSRICSCDISEVNDFHPAWSLQDRTRSFLKVQDGCDYHCSFCTIPLARGKSRSSRIDRVLEQVEKIAASGVKEIVLTGVNLGDFGKSGPGAEEDFLGLIRALDQMESILRFRISSIEPNLLNEDIIHFIAGSKRFMPHFHIPLQSGSNKILGLMKRRYRKELYSSRVRLIQSLMPHCCIGADMITGFPSESQEDFNESFQFVQSLDLSYLHVFTYSERQSTAALDIGPTVPHRERQERTAAFRQLSEEKRADFELRHRGQTRPVLFESGNGEGILEGYSDNYIRVTVPLCKEWVNQVIPWTL
ncbi:MAG TPA: tRNA (N(6)-L-threonylcarbamoyladenosine(37)-C(2))-methylthiotransferase MtaB [Chitinophagaceae bacterium]|nr:tRNA (N(6)-L-threonylcarbamoyladenosine(37)-C(2))-methylthiotransferase MtaB [Chitinophagaceae bacterium]